MALVNPCSLEETISNTGSECDDAMLATRQLFMMHPDKTWLAADEANFTGWLNTQLHAAGAARIYPIFGYGAPVRSITEANEADVLESFDDGAKQLVRRGMMNRTFMTDKGGLCLAQHLFRINRNMSFIEVDEEGKVLRKINADGTRAGFRTNLGYSPTPELATFKTTFKSKLMLDFSPNEYIGQGGIAKGDSTEDILSLIGLIDSAVVKAPVTVQTTTNIYFGVKTNCAETNLVEKYVGTGAGKIGQITNFVVKAANGTIITPSAVAMQVNAAGKNEVKLTGVYTTGTNITVELAAPSILKTNGIEGYEGTVIATIPIP